MRDIEKQRNINKKIDMSLFDFEEGLKLEEFQNIKATYKITEFNEKYINILFECDVFPK